MHNYHLFKQNPVAKRHLTHVVLCNNSKPGRCWCYWANFLRFYMFPHRTFITNRRSTPRTQTPALPNLRHMKQSSRAQNSLVTLTNDYLCDIRPIKNSWNQCVSVAVILLTGADFSTKIERKSCIQVIRKMFQIIGFSMSWKSVQPPSW